ncbi:hypothetical protein EYC84_001892 [Monilinia fructicola]|uniref:Uncharacterized protein n=1 Tax=Monilinia fructicola TaxID=38448 RepID=A0A5M9JV07_MONFR|nr:hypothetical protein EYC84_001892 [Monilinia fructicola]
MCCYFIASQFRILFYHRSAVEHQIAFTDRLKRSILLQIFCFLRIRSSLHLVWLEFRNLCHMINIASRILDR